MLAVTPALLKRWPLPSLANAEGKEARGRVVAVGGSREIPGSILLAGLAALRTGAGKVQLATVREAAVPMAVAFPEARVIGLAARRDGEIESASRALREAASRTDALLVGPGMREGKTVRRLVASLARTCDAPLVLDAGALAAHDACRDATRILLPHAGEMAALLDVDIEHVEADRVGVARAFARDSGAIVVLKGAETCIASPHGRAWLNTGGSVGLGTAGSGDVLAGLVAGLLARGGEPEQAAVWGVALHARIGARLAKRHHTVGFLAREIAWEIPQVLPD